MQEDLLQEEHRRKEAERLRRVAEKAKHLTDVMLGLAAAPNRNTNKGKGKLKGKRPEKGKGKGLSDPLAIARMVQIRQRATTRASMAQARRLGVVEEERSTPQQMSPRVSQIPLRSIGWTSCGR